MSDFKSIPISEQLEYIRKGAKAVGVGSYLTSLGISLGEVRTRAQSIRAVLGGG